MKRLALASTFASVAFILAYLTIASLRQPNDANSSKSTRASSTFESESAVVVTFRTRSQATHTVLRLPDRLDKLSGLDQIFARYEALLLNKSDDLTEYLAARMERETDATYKGLLAILLASTPEGRSRVLKFLHDHQSGQRPVFEALAVYGLVRKLSDIRTVVDSVEIARCWARRFRIATYEAERESALPPEVEPGDIVAQSGNAMQSHFFSDIAPVCDETIFSSVLKYCSQVGLTGDIARAAISTTAGYSLSHADNVLRLWLREPSTSRQLPAMLSGVQFSDDLLRDLHSASRSGGRDDLVAASAIEMLGCQRSQCAAEILLKIGYEQMDAVPLRRTALKSMTWQGDSGFREYALQSLSHLDPESRALSLTLLERVAPQEAESYSIAMLQTDTSVEVRRVALKLLEQRVSVSSAARSAIECAMNRDTDMSIRTQAQAVLARDKDDRLRRVYQELEHN